MQDLRLIPHTVLMPCQELAKHIGVEGGMHAHKISNRMKDTLTKLDTHFFGTKLFGNLDVVPKKNMKPFGGWGHPADQQHCMKLLALTEGSSAQ